MNKFKVKRLCLLDNDDMSLASKLHQNSFNKTSCTSISRALCLLAIHAPRGQVGWAKQNCHVRRSSTLWERLICKPLGIVYCLFTLGPEGTVCDKPDF